MGSLIQTASNDTASGTSVTVTLGANVKAGDGVIVAIATGGGGAGSATITGGSDSFTKAIADGSGVTAVWYIEASAGGYSTVTVAGMTSGGAAWIYEVSPLSALDGTNSAAVNSVASPWTSGSIPGNFTGEIFIGAVTSGWGPGGAISITGPSSPWVNGTSYDVNSTTELVLSGYALPATAGSQTYSGTATGSTPQFYRACGASFKFVPPPISAPVNLRQAVKRAAFY